MDQTDKRILTLLTANARASTAEIARQIHLSRTAVQDRITRLESSGVIQGYTTRTGPGAPGMIRALIFVTIADRPCDPALNWLAGLEGVEDVTSLAGEVDAIVSCCLADAAALAALNDRIGSSDLILSARSTLVLRQLSGRGA